MADDTKHHDRGRRLARAHQGLFRGTAARNEARHLAELEAGARHHRVVIVAVFAFAAYFAVVDTLVGRGIQKLFDTFTK